jgi:hypothetical protein
MQQVVVRPETALIRPYVVAAILRGVKFDPVRYDSFIDLQVGGLAFVSLGGERGRRPPSEGRARGRVRGAAVSAGCKGRPGPVNSRG